MPPPSVPAVLSEMVLWSIRRVALGVDSATAQPAGCTSSKTASERSCRCRRWRPSMKDEAVVTVALPNVENPPPQASPTCCPRSSCRRCPRDARVASVNVLKMPPPWPIAVLLRIMLSLRVIVPTVADSATEAVGMIALEEVVGDHQQAVIIEAATVVERGIADELTIRRPLSSRCCQTRRDCGIHLHSRPSGCPGRLVTVAKPSDVIETSALEHGSVAQERFHGSPACHELMTPPPVASDTPVISPWSVTSLWAGSKTPLTPCVDPWPHPSRSSRINVVDRQLADVGQMIESRPAVAAAW